MYRLAIFDLDGTVLNTLDDLADALNHTLREFSFPEKTVTEVRSLVGRGLRNLVRDASGSADGDAIDALHAEMVSFYSAHSAEKTAPYPGIPELLEELRSAGIRTAVLSNKKDEVTVSLCAGYFPEMFDLCQGEKDGIPMKPSPEPVLSVMEKLGCSREETVYIGDSEVDIATANNAGVACIAVTWGFRDRDVLEEAGAALIAEDPQELKRLLLS